jgi:hypothetical protein
VTGGEGSENDIYPQKRHGSRLANAIRKEYFLAILPS